MKLSKKKGEIVDESIAVLIALFSIFVIIVGFINHGSAICTRLNVDRIERHYMLKCESQGYLTSDNLASLERELSDIKLTNIDLTGTTTNEVQNGGDIKIDIKYTQKVKELTLGNGFNVKFIEKPINSEQIFSSTSKD